MTRIDPNTSPLNASTQVQFPKTKQGYMDYMRLHGDQPPQYEAIAEKTEVNFSPIEPIEKPGLNRNTNIFTGTEMNSAVAMDESASGKAERALNAAQKLVASTLVEPILKQVRETNTTPPPFGPGKAEKQFSTFLDAQLSDRIVSAANFPLVQRIQQDLLSHSSYMNDATKAVNERTPTERAPRMDLMG